jgi:membrane protease YdiL (CAAX protease family)
MFERISLLRMVVGYLVMYGALKLSGRAFEAWGLAAGKSLAAIAGLAVALLVRAVLDRQQDPRRVMLSLGFGRPDVRVLLLSTVVSGALLATLPFIVAAGGGAFVLPDNWIMLAVSIFLLNGLAEETVYRGYLFHQLRASLTFRKAVVVGTLFAATAHVPIIASAGPVVGGLAIGVAVLTFLPFALLFECCGNAVWAPAIVHFAAGCVIPLGALGLVPPLAIAYWMLAQIVACYVAAWAASSVASIRPQWRMTAESGDG